MNEPTKEKIIEWQKRAAQKGAIVPSFFEVFPTRVTIVCGNCQSKYVRNLIPNVNEPVFVCPIKECRARNWVPIRYKH